MSVVSAFEPAFLAWLATRLNDVTFKLYFGRVPEGQPTNGIKEVAIWYVPGGDRQLTHGGMSGEEGRRIQFSIFAIDPQAVRDGSKALHLALEGFSGDIGGAHVWAIVPGSQDRDSYDSDEKVFQTDFDVIVRMSSEQ